MSEGFGGIEQEIQKGIQGTVERLERRGGRRRPERTLIQACGKPGAEQSLLSCKWSENRTEKSVIEEVFLCLPKIYR